MVYRYQYYVFSALGMIMTEVKSITSRLSTRVLLSLNRVFGLALLVSLLFPQSLRFSASLSFPASRSFPRLLLRCVLSTCSLLFSSFVAGQVDIRLDPSVRERVSKIALEFTLRMTIFIDRIFMFVGGFEFSFVFSRAIAQV